MKSIRFKPTKVLRMETFLKELSVKETIIQKKISALKRKIKAEMRKYVQCGCCGTWILKSSKKKRDGVEYYYCMFCEKEITHITQLNNNKDY